MKKKTMIKRIAAVAVIAALVISMMAISVTSAGAASADTASTAQTVTNASTMFPIYWPIYIPSPNPFSPVIPPFIYF